MFCVLHLVGLILMTFNYITEFKCALLYNTGFIISLSKFIERKTFIIFICNCSCYHKSLFNDTINRSYN